MLLFGDVSLPKAAVVALIAAGNGKITLRDYDQELALLFKLQDQCSAAAASSGLALRETQLQPEIDSQVTLI